MYHANTTWQCHLQRHLFFLCWVQIQSLPYPAWLQQTGYPLKGLITKNGSCRMPPRLQVYSSCAGCKYIKLYTCMVIFVDTLGRHACCMPLLWNFFVVCGAVVVWWWWVTFWGLWWFYTRIARHAPWSPEVSHSRMSALCMQESHLRIIKCQKVITQSYVCSYMFALPQAEQWPLNGE